MIGSEKAGSLPRLRQSWTPGVKTLPAGTEASPESEAVPLSVAKFTGQNPAGLPARRYPGSGAVEHAAESNELDPETWRLPNLRRDHRAGYAVSGAASIHGAEKIPCRPDTGRLTASPFNTAFLPPAPTASDARLQPSAPIQWVQGAWDLPPFQPLAENRRATVPDHGAHNQPLPR